MKVPSRGLLLVSLLLLPSLLLAAPDTKPIATKPVSKISSAKSPIDAKVEALLRKMTLEEKIGQMTQYHQWKQMDADHKKDITDGKIGSFLNLFGAKSTNETQKIAVEGTRLHIPLIFGLDVIHGYKTIFPIPLAEDCAWN